MPLSVGNPSGLMQSNILYCFVYYVCVPGYGWRMALYAFRSSTWLSGGRPILGHLGSFWPFIWQAVAGSCKVLGDAARASSPGFSEDTCSR
jgi:hypothetical protein